MADVRHEKICLALVWHMHQPHYENPFTGQFELPWVRLHGTKDYYDMAALAESYPRVRFTINVVPSLLEQIDDYVSGRRTDRFLDLSRRGPAELDPGERRFVEENFFSANEATMIARYPRLAELHRRFKNRVPGRQAPLFSDTELRDLIVLFNLAWIDPTFFVDREHKRSHAEGQHFAVQPVVAVGVKREDCVRVRAPLSIPQRRDRCGLNLAVRGQERDPGRARGRNPGLDRGTDAAVPRVPEDAMRAALQCRACGGLGRIC